ncbi:sodium-dependent lysophosphatidylcholine symporter 1-like [Ostrea edulis]|uniref:sodium-dependent lysophosphatidylcholine symporter 1-like n=1 Tax=Ostrea edulis TaxID=37623 RepID=UPI0024AEF47E|nr:sodium-dependent lysophosphatidylcholine symporter 1-like [Ostrea edulis]
MYRQHNKMHEDMESGLTEGLWEKSHGLPIWRKICFAIGGAPYQITSTVLGFFMSIFLLEVAQVQPAYVSVIVFGGKLWYAMTDPICGYLVNQTTHTSLGKYRPWILLTTPFACITYLCFWLVPDYSEEGKLVWYLTFYCLFQGFLSGVHVPYTSMTMSISDSQKERDSITAYRMVAEAIGVMMGVIIQGHFIKKHRTAGVCNKASKSLNITMTTKDNLIHQISSYHDASVTIVSIYVICILVCFCGTKEQRVKQVSPGEGFFVGLRKVLFFRPYLKLSMAVLFLSVAISITQGSLALFCTHTLGMGQYFSTFITIIMASTICSLPVWHFIQVRIGKRRTFAAGMLLFIPVLLSQLFLHDSFFAYTIVLVFAGLSIAVSLLLPWSMLPDVIDDFYVTHGEHKDAIFYSFYVFFNKLATGVAVATSQLALKYGGYRVGDCEQPPGVGQALRYLMIPGPITAVVIALFGFGQIFPEMGRSFNMTYRCYSVTMLGERDDVERGGKIIMPPSALDQLTRLHIQYPMLFKLTNKKKNRETHCGVLEFVADEGRIYIPYWMMTNLLLTEGDLIQVENVSLKVATFARFQPQSVDFLDITNPKAVLENMLRSFACLTTDDVISIKYNERNYDMLVLETKPDRAVSIIECDMNVDFAPPVGYKEPQAQRRAQNEEEMASAEVDDMDVTDSSFKVFGGAGNRLDGKKKGTEPSPVQANTSAPKRGIPDYGYTKGTIKFIRTQRQVNNETLEEEKSFEAFSGAGQSLRKKGRK